MARIISSALALVLLSAAAAVAGPRAPHVRSFDFTRDAEALGFVVQGVEDGRFTDERHALSLLHDSTEPGSRLLAPLPWTLDGTDSFSVEVDLEIIDLQASPTDFFQLSFGLVNRELTGLNRTGTALPGAPFFEDDSDAFHAVEFAYFPNETFFGGPFLQPGVYGADAGGSIFANFAANFGPSADLGDNGPDQVREMPLARRLRVVMAYDACSELLRTRVLDLSGRDPVELDTGIEPVDVSFVNATGTFRVDAFAINAYRDLADFDTSSRSILANLRFFDAAVERRRPLSARLLPAHVNAQAQAPARVRVEGAGADATVVLAATDDSAPELPLVVRATPRGALIADVPRELAAEGGLVLEVDGCLVPVAEGPGGR